MGNSSNKIMIGSPEAERLKLGGMSPEMVRRVASDPKRHSVDSLHNPESVIDTNHAFLLMHPELIPDYEELKLTKMRIELIPPNITSYKSAKTVSIDLSDNIIFRMPNLARAYPNLTSLDIGNNSFKSFPKSLLKLTSLHVLRCYQNKLKSIPAKIRQLTKLEELNLFDTHLKKLPTNIEMMISLQELNVAGNPLQKLPSLTDLVALTTLACFNCQLTSLADLRGAVKLESLRAFNNQLTAFPRLDGANQSNLKIIDLAGNKITEIPASIGLVKTLTFLNISRNQIEVLPAELGKLTRLEIFRASTNAIVKIPTKFYECKNLRELDMSNNKVEKLSREIGKLRKVHSIYLQGNQLKVLPNELVEVKNLTRLKLLRNPMKAKDETTIKTIGMLVTRLGQNFDYSFMEVREFDTNGEMLHPFSVRIIQEKAASVTAPVVNSSSTYNSLEQQDVNVQRKREHKFEKFVDAVEIFGSLSKKEKLKLATAFELVEIPKGKAIVRQGDEGDKFYVIYQGKVQFEVQVPESQEKLTVGTAFEGEYFGELALLNNGIRKATVRALGNCTLLVLAKNVFQRPEKSFEVSLGEKCQ